MSDDRLAELILSRLPKENELVVFSADKKLDFDLIKLKTLFVQFTQVAGIAMYFSNIRARARPRDSQQCSLLTTPSPDVTNTESRTTSSEIATSTRRAHEPNQAGSTIGVTRRENCVLCIVRTSIAIPNVEPREDDTGIRIDYNRTVQR